MDVTRAAVYDRDANISVRDVPLPPPGDGELLVRITACGICPGESMDWYVARKAPFVLGHEPVGVVEGGDDRAFRRGARVFVHHHAACMRCERCRRGDFVQCDAWRATRLIPGGMSRFAVVQAPGVATDVLALPDAIDDDTATFIEPLATVVKSMRRAGGVAGRRVLVIGLGVMGLLHILVARERGAALVLGSDTVAGRRDAAVRSGADRAFAPEDLAAQVIAATGGEGADVVIVGPGSTAAMDAAAASVARGGTIVLFTPLPPDARWAMPVHDFYFRDVSVVTSYSAGPNDTRAAMELLGNGLTVRSLITHRFPLGDVQKAYKLVADAGEALKVIVYPGQE